MQSLEERKLFAATGVNVVDSSGPIEQMIQAGGQIYVSSRHGPGSSLSQIYVTDGVKKNTRLLLDLSATGSQIASIGEIAATDDGRVFFTATAAGGKHLFELNTKTGGYTQLSSGTSQSWNTLTAAGNRLFAYQSNEKTVYAVNAGQTAPVAVAQVQVDSTFHAAGTYVFFTGPAEKLYRSDGTPGGTVVVSADYVVNRSDFFTSNEHVYFEASKAGENRSLFRVGLSGTSPVKIADDFYLLNTSHAELDGYVYFSGGYYNTSPKGGDGAQLYRAQITTGNVGIASKITGSNGAGRADAISAIGTSIYFTAGDGDYIPSQGTTDRELYRFNTTTKQVVKVTKNETLYPVEMGAGALSSYYFVAAPTKDDARFGSRALYRTNPITDQIELVSGVPTVSDLNGKPYQKVRSVAVGSRGFFFAADSDTNGRDTDVFFSATPFSVLDPATTILTIEGTEFADELTLRIDGNHLVVTQNGVEERHLLASIGRIEAYLKAGDDLFTADPDVAINTYVFGDLGNDTITTGSGRDTITGGAGKNYLYGGEGDDRINGSGGRDYLDGQGGHDRLYGNGGNDTLLGGMGIDRLWGGDGDDWMHGGQSNDKLYGDAGNDTLFGDKHDDLLFGGDGDDEIDGGIGNDTLDGNAGNDTLIGGDGDDVINAIDGYIDHITAGGGIDTATTDDDDSLVDLIEILN
jgi:Ca2+-binding RTX toxin-like protein